MTEKWLGKQQSNNKKMQLVCTEHTVVSFEVLPEHYLCPAGEFPRLSWGFAH